MALESRKVLVQMIFLLKSQGSLPILGESNYAPIPSAVVVLEWVFGYLNTEPHRVFGALGNEQKTDYE